jgi:hypothetical protein
MNYRSKPGISGTQLVQLDRSPAHYNYLTQNPIEPTPAMEFGTAAHTMLLETSLFNSRYAVYTGEGTRASKEYKEFASKQVGKSIIKNEDYERILDMMTVLQNHSLARELLINSKGQNELELYWTEAGVNCKGKLDRYLPAENVVVDYKTAHDASPDSFNQWKAKAMGYYLQSAHYQAGIKALHSGTAVPAFVFVVQETEAPYGVQVYELDTISIDKAHEKRAELLQVYKLSVETGKWMSYKEEVIKL